MRPGIVTMRLAKDASGDEKDTVGDQTDGARLRKMSAWPDLVRGVGILITRPGLPVGEREVSVPGMHPVVGPGLGSDGSLVRIIVVRLNSIPRWARSDVRGHSSAGTFAPPSS